MIRRTFIAISMSLAVLSCLVWYAYKTHDLQAQITTDYQGAVDLFDEGNYENALMVLDTLSEDAPGDGDALTLKTRTLLRMGGDLSQAADSARRAVRLNPDSADSHTQLGFVLQIQGKREDNDAKSREAIVHLERAIGLDPDLAEAYAVLGYAYRDIKSLEQAVKALRRALELQPDASLVQAVLQHIEGGRYD